MLSLLSLVPMNAVADTAGLTQRIVKQATEFVVKRVTLPYDSICVDVSVPPIAARASEIAHFSLDLYGTHGHGPRQDLERCCGFGQEAQAARDSAR